MSSATEPRHPIQVVARRTGLSADTLRAWERRYQAVVPQRSSSGQRLYSDADIERLQLLRQLILGGRRIGQLAPLSPARLRALAQEDAERAVPQTQATEPAPTAGEAAGVDELLASLMRLDAAAVEAQLAAAAARLGALPLLDLLVWPLLERIGTLWEQGGLSPAHEHLAVVQVRALLTTLLAHQLPRPTAPAIVVTTLPGQRHELGALGVALTAACLGWRATFLGGDMPPEDTAEAARQTAARAVALSHLVAEQPEDTAANLRRLAEALPRGTRLIVGGPGARELGDTLVEVGAVYLSGLDGLRSELAELVEPTRSA